MTHTTESRGNSSLSHIKVVLVGDPWFMGRSLRAVQYLSLWYDS